MVFQAPPTQRHEVQILTSHFQFDGQLETVGSMLNYINDAAHDSLSLYDAHTAPLAPGSPLKGFSRPHIVVRRPQIVLLYFTAAETRASIRTHARSELLVAYTPVAICQGHFHMPAEARVRDFLDGIKGDLAIVTEARIFPLVEFPASFPTEAELVLIGRSQLLSYHPA